MRACGVETALSDQIEQIAQMILSASALRDPADHRAQKLAEVLQYLEHRVERLLDGHWMSNGSQSGESGTTADQEDRFRDADVAPAAARVTKSVPPVVASATAGGDAAPPDPRASGESPLDSIARQVEQDLLSLSEFPLGVSAPAKADPSTPAPPAKTVACAGPSAGPKPLASPAAALAPRSDPWHPVPSMWEPGERKSPSRAGPSDHLQPPPSPAVDLALAGLVSNEIAAQVIATTMAPMRRTEPLPHQQADDLLAALAAMSDEERIALFT
jgi:hypothetical protein